MIVAFSLFDQGIILNMVYPPLALLSTFIGMTLYRIASVQSEKKEITSIFGRYVPPQVVRKIISALDEGELKLGGDQHDVTVMFADIRGFTSMSDKIEPEELVRALNLYLSTVVAVASKYDGMINKFGGDSVMVVWNVPIMCKEHAYLAVRAATETQRAIEDLQAKEPTLPKMVFGIGINTGKAIAGNIGSTDRLEYSVIGDPVNLAYRITSIVPGGKVWIGTDTYELIKERVIVKQVTPLIVKGKHEPVTVYEVTWIAHGNSAEETNDDS
jgi:adenylate cyclase